MFDLIRDYFQRLHSPAYNLGHVAIELILIGVVVYACVRFLRGTRGERLFSGVVVVLVAVTIVVKVVAREFGLERVDVLYGPFVTGMFLVALVVFQPELRRGLMRVGEARWLRPWARGVGEVVDHLVAASEYFSKNKIGAIIAIEREVPLGSIIEGGMRLDAELSAELLKTVFWPGSVLHDLGVIIQRGRIAAAGCQFPLAEVGELDQSFGGRHRAAVGMSHDSDAVVLVVSEETGMISLAHRGVLRQGVPIDRLRDALMALLAEGTDGEQREDGGHGKEDDAREDTTG